MISGTMVKNISVSGFRSQVSGFKPATCDLWRAAICSFLFLVSFWIPCSAQEDNKLVALTKQIIEAKTNEELYPALEELKNLYLKENKYNDFVDFLDSLAKQKNTLEAAVNYYIAYSRCLQLKYLEEVQSWDEYFSQGNNYRDQITASLQKTIDSTTAKDALHINGRLLLWQFHKGQQDVFSEQALSDLLNSVLEYSKEAKEVKPIKEAADKLLVYGEKGKSKELYKIYVSKIVTSDIKDVELNTIALGSYNEGNLDLAEEIYDVYIERIQKSLAKEKLTPLLIDIAKLFYYNDERPSDALYAEKIFKKIEEVGTKEAFDEELIYLRAFNLEKAKEYPKAKDIYLDLVQRYPQTLHRGEADFKEGIIYTYILRDIKTGKSYFEKLALSANPEPVEESAQKETPSPQVISSLYQLGLLSQWEEDLVKAKEYYDKLVEEAKDGFAETVTLAKERLKEIQEAKPLEYNLKTFLDVSLKDEYTTLDTSKLDLRARPYKTKRDAEVSINSTPYIAQSGCLQVELQYLWSGHLGKVLPSSDAPSLNTNYMYPGTKEINLVVVSPTGVIDRNIDLVDVY